MRSLVSKAITSTSVLSISLMISAVVPHAAFAQATTTLPKKAKAASAAPAVVAPVVVSPSASAPGEVAGQSSGQSMTSGQSTVQLATQVKAAEQPKKVSATVILHNEAPVLISQNGKADQDVSQFIEMLGTYKLTPDQSLSAYVELDHSWGAKRDGKADFAFVDPYLQYSKSKLVKTPVADISVFARPYLILSEASRNKGYNSIVRLGATVTKEVNKTLTLTYEFEPRFYSSYKDSYLVEETVGKGDYKRKATTSFALVHFVEAAINITDKLTLTQDLGLRRTFYNSAQDVKNTGMTEAPYADTSLNYKFNPQFSLNVGIDEDAANSAAAPNLLAQGREFSLYRDDESIYYIEASATF